MVARLWTVTNLQNQLKSLDMKKVAKSLQWSKQKLYEYSNKPHRMLVNKMKSWPFHSSPDFLMQTNGSPTYCPSTMSKVFREFYHGLYNYLKTDPNYQFTQANFDSFFDSLTYLNSPRPTFHL